MSIILHSLTTYYEVISHRYELCCSRSRLYI